jgi:uncharacterized protein (TIRG00374 family)
VSETTTARRALHLCIGVGLSGLFLYLALAGEDWEAIGTAVRDAHWPWLLAMIPFGAYVLFVRSQRWRLLLERGSGRSVPLLPVYSASAIGFMANMVLPFRVGEFARPYLVARSTGVSLSATIASVVIERVLDLLALFSFACYVVLMSPTPPMVKNLTVLAGGAAAVAGLFAWLLSVQRERFQPIVDAVLRIFPDRIGHLLRGFIEEFLHGMAAISDLKVMAVAIAWSLYIWGLVACSFALGFPAMEIDLPFLQGGVTVATIVALAVSIPSAPAFVGQFEWGTKLALETILGVRGGVAVGYALVVHAVQFVGQVGLGLGFLVREGVSIGDLGRMESEVVDTTEHVGDAAEHLGDARRRKP